MTVGAAQTIGTWNINCYINFLSFNRIKEAFSPANTYQAATEGSKQIFIPHSYTNDKPKVWTGTFYTYEIKTLPNPGTNLGTVNAVSQTDYPNGGTQGSYYYRYVGIR